MQATYTSLARKVNTKSQQQTTTKARKTPKQED
jgi:hypothetical protein